MGGVGLSVDLREKWPVSDGKKEDAASQAILPCREPYPFQESVGEAERGKVFENSMFPRPRVSNCCLPYICCS